MALLDIEHLELRFAPIGSPMLKARAPLVLDLPEEAWFDVGLMQKDIRLVLEAGDVPLASARAADEVLTKAGELGFEHRDIAAARECRQQPGPR